MAGHLGLRVVAEGIESDAQACYLKSHGRPYMQGFLYHRPMPLEQLLGWLDDAAGEAAAGMTPPALEIAAV